MPTLPLTQRNRTPMHDLPLPQQAGILCNDAQFRAYVIDQCELPDTDITVTAAAEYLRQQCQIPSRRDLATNPTAQTRFAALLTEYDAWRGRIAKPR